MMAKMGATERNLVKSFQPPTEEHLYRKNIFIAMNPEILPPAPLPHQ